VSAVKLADDRWPSAVAVAPALPLPEEHPWPGSAFCGPFWLQANNVIKVGISS